jgi:hypothetical protein
VGIAKEAGAEIANFDPGDMALKALQILKESEKQKLDERFSKMTKEEYLEKYKETFI